MPHVLVWDIETVPDLRGFAAANGLDGQSDDDVRAAICDKFPKDKAGAVTSGAAQHAAPVSCLCDQPRREYIIHCHGIFRHLRVDDGFKRAVTFPTAPKMTNVPLTPMLGPFGGN
jgi:hypothetical protein